MTAKGLMMMMMMTTTMPACVTDAALIAGQSMKDARVNREPMPEYLSTSVHHVTITIPKDFHQTTRVTCVIRLTTHEVQKERETNDFGKSIRLFDHKFLAHDAVAAAADPDLRHTITCSSAYTP